MIKHQSQTSTCASISSSESPSSTLSSSSSCCFWLLHDCSLHMFVHASPSRLIDNLRLAKLLAEDNKPVDNTERQTHSSKRKRAPVPSHQRRHDTDNNDRGNTTNNTINDGGDSEDTGEFAQPFWTRAKSKAGKALTTQKARNNRNNKQRLRLSDHDIHNTPGRDSRRRSYSDVTRSTMTCQFCAEP